jgi:hypothetical protein
MAKKRNPSKKRDPFASAVIRELGGPAEAARIFGIKPPSIIGWLEKGIPKARLMYLEVAYPKVMRAARKVKENGEMERIASIDDTQQNAGGSLDRKTKESRRAL